MRPAQRKLLIEQLWNRASDQAREELWYHDETGAAEQLGIVYKDVFQPNKQYTIGLDSDNTFRYAILDYSGRIVSAYTEDDTGKHRFSARLLDELLEDYIHRHLDFVVEVEMAQNLQVSN